MKFSITTFTFTANATKLDNGEQVTLKVEGDANGFTFTSIPFPTAQVPVPNGDNLVDLTHLTNSSVDDTTNVNESTTDFNLSVDDSANVGNDEEAGAGRDEHGLPTLFDDDVAAIGDRLQVLNTTTASDSSDEYEGYAGVSQESFF